MTFFQCDTTIFPRMENSPPASFAPGGTERRHLQRSRVLKGALIVFGQMTHSFDCLVRNLTAEGAKLTFASTLGVPEEFFLFLSNDHRIAPVRIVWRTEREAGVSFTGDWQYFEPGLKTPHPKAPTYKVT